MMAETGETRVATSAEIVMPREGGVEVLEVRRRRLSGLEHGQVMVRVEAAGVSFAEVQMLKGRYFGQPKFPFVPGYDLVGRVEAVGEGVDEGLLGERVAALTQTGADGQLNQAPISLEEFKAEALRARSALDLYADLYEGGGRSALKERIRALRKDYLRIGRPLSELDKYFVSRWGEVSDEPGWDDGSLLFVAARRLEGFVLSRVEDVRLGFWGELVPWDPSRAYKPVQSWRCPDLRSAIYLQFYFWMTDALPMRRCLNPACEMPFPAARRDKRVCSRTCRSNLRHYPQLQRRT